MSPQLLLEMLVELDELLVGVVERAEVREILACSDQLRERSDLHVQLPLYGVEEEGFGLKLLVPPQEYTCWPLRVIQIRYMLCVQ